MKKILVPTDFSQGSLNAYKYALKLAHKLNAKVTLYHVYGFGESGKHRPQSLSETLESENEEDALSVLEGYGYAVQRDIDTEIPSTYILERGRPVKSIVEYADFMEVDLIVMNTWWAEGLGEKMKTWLGNVGTQVIAETTRPVLLVPDGVGFQDFKHIAYSTNFGEKKQRVPTELIGLSDAFDSRISILHVRRPGTAYDPIYFAFLREIYSLEMDNFNIHYYAIHDKEIIEGLNTFVEREGVNILAMLIHERLTIFDRILGTDVPRKMAFHSKIPLLVLHQEYENGK